MDGHHALPDCTFEDIDACFEQTLKERSDQEEGQIEDQRHDADEDGDAGVFSGQDLIDLLTADVFLTLVRFYDAGVTDFLNEIKAHVRDGGAVVHAALLLHLKDDVGEHFLLVRIEIQSLGDELVALDQLAGGKADGQFRAGGVVLDQVAHGMDRAMNRSAVVLGPAEVLPGRLFLIFCDVDGVVNELVDAFIFCG